nr:hypothetical protein [Tanacetum cinerariifolium]
MSARIAEAAALSPSSFRKRYISSYETPSLSSSLTLPIRKRYQEDEGLGSEDEEEASPEGQQQAVLVVDTAVDEPLGLSYEALRCLDTDSASKPFIDFRETEIPQPLPITPSPVPPSDYPYLIVRQAYTPATIDTKFEPKEAPSETKEFEASEPSDTMITSSYSTASSDSTTQLSPDHPLA